MNYKTSNPIDNANIAMLYPIPPGPYQASLLQAVSDIYYGCVVDGQTLPREIENALYFAVKRYLCKREYQNDDLAYLQGILSDVEQGKRHHNEACFYHSDADHVFRSLKYTIIGLQAALLTNT